MTVPDILAPTTETELAGLLATHHATGTPLRIAGGGTRLDRAETPGATLTTTTLTTAALCGVVDYEPGAMTLIARTGTPLAEIESLVAAEGQSLAFEPPDLRGVIGTRGTPTLGGVIATNASGPRRIAIGACRDHLLGVRFVDGRGRVVKNGGRVMKNVTGLDLGKLFAGSHGTLGVLTEVALKTLPMAPAGRTLMLPGLSAAEAVKVFCKVLATPFEITGAAWADQTAWLRIEGLDTQVAYRCDRLAGLLGGLRIDMLDQTDTRAHWQDLRDLRHMPGDGPLWRILVKPTDAPALVLALSNHGGRLAMDWGGGLIWYAGPLPAADLRRMAGHATLMRRGGLSVPAFPRQADTLRQLSDRLRDTFDPARILNRGLMESC